MGRSGRGRGKSTKKKINEGVGLWRERRGKGGMMLRAVKTVTYLQAWLTDFRTKWLYRGAPLLEINKNLTLDILDRYTTTTKFTG